MSARPFAAHLRYRTVEYLREPLAVGPTLAFPLMITAFFIIPSVPPEGAPIALAIVLLLSFTMVALFSFGAGTAEERRLPWGTFLRALPLRPRVALGAYLFVGLLFSVIGALPSIGLLGWELGLSVPMDRWPLLGTAVLLGATAMAGTGLTIGYALTPRAAIATANLVFLPLAFVGGLFLPPESLPAWAAAAGWATPMRPWVEVTFAAALGTSAPAAAWALLVAWTIGLCSLATWTYLRDRTRRFT
jgi:ABC-2 type transport system permease protein